MAGAFAQRQIARSIRSHGNLTLLDPGDSQPLRPPLCSRGRAPARRSSNSRGWKSRSNTGKYGRLLLGHSRCAAECTRAFVCSRIDEKPFSFFSLSHSPSLSLSRCVFFICKNGTKRGDAIVRFYWGPCPRIFLVLILGAFGGLSRPVFVSRRHVCFFF